MSEPEKPAAKTPDEIKADIEATRAQLAETADALAAKADVKAQAGAKLHETGEKAGEAYDRAKGATPVPVQHAIGKVEQVAAPAVAKAGEDKKRTALVVAGLVVAFVVVRRIRRSRAED